MQGFSSAKAASVHRTGEGCVGPPGLFLLSHGLLSWLSGSRLAPGLSHGCPLSSGGTGGFPWSNHGARDWSTGTHGADTEPGSGVQVPIERLQSQSLKCRYSQSNSVSGAQSVCGIGVGHGSSGFEAVQQQLLVGNTAASPFPGNLWQ